VKELLPKMAEAIISIEIDPLERQRRFSKFWILNSSKRRLSEPWNHVHEPKPSSDSRAKVRELFQQ